ncbi:basic proline-rich protein-like [Melozone crissalis]|uniref:basic proline-rich protein-like n=1 Tax=Melozone crissalis TaxID=40204 RepID=UPI0023DB4384|nr:basic proline-rich protein-like [Melozone crissalis]
MQPAALPPPRHGAHHSQRCPALRCLQPSAQALRMEIPFLAPGERRLSGKVEQSSAVTRVPAATGDREPGTSRAGGTAERSGHSGSSGRVPPLPHRGSTAPHRGSSRRVSIVPHRSSSRRVSIAPHRDSPGGSRLSAPGLGSPTLRSSNLSERAPPIREVPKHRSPFVCEQRGGPARPGAKPGPAAAPRELPPPGAPPPGPRSPGPARPCPPRVPRPAPGGPVPPRPPPVRRRGRRGPFGAERGAQPGPGGPRGPHLPRAPRVPFAAGRKRGRGRRYQRRQETNRVPPRLRRHPRAAPRLRQPRACALRGAGPVAIGAGSATARINDIYCSTEQRAVSVRARSGAVATLQYTG